MIGLGVILLIAAAVTILRPDKPTKPAGPGETPTDDHTDPADSGHPLKAAAS